MADKKITDLQLISAITGSMSFPIDDAIQTYRGTPTQMQTFITKLTTRGDLMYRGAADNARLAKGSEGMQLIQGADDPAWGFPLSNQVAAQTTTYAIPTTAFFVPLTATGAAFTATLPTAVGRAGKEYVLYRTDQTLANLITIATTSSQTIGAAGTTIKLATQHQLLRVMSDGANWVIIAHHIPKVQTSYTPAITGHGTPTINYFQWSRNLNYCILEGTWAAGTVTGADLTVPLPTGLTADISQNTVVGGALITAYTGTVGDYLAPVMYTATPTVVTFGKGNGSSWFVKLLGNSVSTNSSSHSLYAEIPIVDWKAA
jgi:hypothetical protein